jgi:hypothetical protein
LIKRVFINIKSLAGLLALFFLIILSLILLRFYFHADKQLTRATKNLRDLGNQYIDYSLVIEDSIPLTTFINIGGRVPTNIQMAVVDSIPVLMNVNFKDSLRLPINIQVSDLIKIDTVVNFPNPFLINIKSTIPVEQKMKMVSLAGINVKVKTDIPLNQTVQANINDSVRIVSSVPINMQIAQDIPVKLNLHIPIRDKIGIRLPINNTALVSFPASIPINGFIPIKLKVDVRIPISETPIKKYLDSTADNLDKLLRVDWR